MLRRTVVVSFSPKGLFSRTWRPRNPGMMHDLAPKGLDQKAVILPKTNAPFDDDQTVHRELLGGFWNRFPQIMRGYQGRAGRNHGSMVRAARWHTMKISAYRWLKKAELMMLRVNNITAGMEEHGMGFKEYRYKRTLQDIHLTNAMSARLAKYEPLAFRALAETLRSENLLMYDKHPEYRDHQTERNSRIKDAYNKYAMQSPLPTRRRAADPTWREIPLYQGRQHDAKFHAEHPVFLTDWKI
eukprot:TRINITY_DN37934_c0_g1_i1.p2 TRINITY_DN37934_c0_g1~~TRINITY_DN37934_c0_g1_i1.p2  ORF type:complete len:263 (+),score=94.82 TRINITY_DN37934_c0_g1_i1:66-791(+)